MDECTAGTSVSTIRSLHINMPHQSVPISSMPSTPGSSALPSSPADSVSSLPSVGSSYFFSSAAASPPHSQPSSDHHHAHGLVIPELTLPSALRRPTPYGQTLGDLRILVTGTGKRQLARQLVDDNDDVVEVGTWHDAEGGCSVLHASTDWIEHRDAHGLEKFEGTRNVEIVELPSYEHTDDPVEIEASIASMIRAPFHSIAQVIDPTCPPSAVLSNLLSSPFSPLYTALVFLLPDPPSALETHLITTLGPLIPLILLSPRTLSLPPRTLSSFQPPAASPAALRAALFRTPDALTALRAEAADRFLRWREVQRLVPSPTTATAAEGAAWSKRAWEAEWEGLLSADVARARGDTVTQDSRPRTPAAPCFDPLHLPSLLALSLALLKPARARAGRSVARLVARLGEWDVGLALVGSFCVGIGIGMVIRDAGR